MQPDGPVTLLAFAGLNASLVRTKRCRYLTVPAHSNARRAMPSAAQAASFCKSMQCNARGTFTRADRTKHAASPRCFAQGQNWVRQVQSLRPHSASGPLPLRAKPRSRSCIASQVLWKVAKALLGMRQGPKFALRHWLCSTGSEGRLPAFRGRLRAAIASATLPPSETRSRISLQAYIGFAGAGGFAPKATKALLGRCAKLLQPCSTDHAQQA